MKPKKDTKQLLFENMVKLNPDFKPKLNEWYDDDYGKKPQQPRGIGDFNNIDWHMLYEQLQINYHVLVKSPGYEKAMTANYGDLTDYEGLVTPEEMQLLEDFGLVEKMGAFPVIGEDFGNEESFKAKAKEIWNQESSTGDQMNETIIDQKENLEYFLSYNNDDVYWKWINGEIDDSGAIEIMRDIEGMNYDPNVNYKEEYSSVNESPMFGGQLVSKDQYDELQYDKSNMEKAMADAFATPPDYQMKHPVRGGETIQLSDGDKVLVKSVKDGFINVRVYPADETAKKYYKNGYFDISWTPKQFDAIVG